MYLIKHFLFLLYLTSDPFLKYVHMKILTASLCIIHEDSASRAIIAKQVARSPEKRGLPRAEGDRVRCNAIMASGVE